MKDKYNLSQQENLFLAKKTIVNTVYNSAKLEGINITFPQTKTILDGVSVSNLDMDDIQTILNLRNAWKYLLNHVNEKFNLEFAKKIHSFVGYNEALNWGELRNGHVGITGVHYKPEIPIESEVMKEMNEILSINCVTERAITYMLWGMRKQLFWDGNKRTSTLLANKMLIENGKGIITIPEKYLEEFNERLSKFYETNQYTKIIFFIYDKCLFGIDYY
jgi:Fic family protein